jgi:hypothetical protein
MPAVKPMRSGYSRARYVSFQMAEVAIPRILRMIAKLRPPTKVCLYDGKFGISPALQPERPAGVDPLVLFRTLAINTRVYGRFHAGGAKYGQPHVLRR